MDGGTGRGLGGEATWAATAVPGIARTASRSDRTLAPATSRTYAADWHHFVEWCRTEGHASLPAAAATLASYLTALAPTLGRSALDRRGAQASCPVRALQDWTRASDCGFGPVFRKVDRWGNVEHRRLGADAIRRILRRRDTRSGRTRRSAAKAA